MGRCISCLAVTLLMGTPLWAGELDAEFAAKKPAAAVTSATPAPQPVAAVAKASELDGEMPAQSGRGWGGRGWGGGWGRGWGGGWGRGWGGWGRGWGWGGWGWRGGWGVGWGWGRGWGGWGWGGYAYWPGYAYYPGYVAYSYYGYPTWGYCW